MLAATKWRILWVAGWMLIGSVMGPVALGLVAWGAFSLVDMAFPNGIPTADGSVMFTPGFHVEQGRDAWPVVAALCTVLLGGIMVYLARTRLKG